MQSESPGSRNSWETALMIFTEVEVEGRERFMQVGMEFTVDICQSSETDAVMP